MAILDKLRTHTSRSVDKKFWTPQVQARASALGGMMYHGSSKEPRRTHKSRQKNELGCASRAGLHCLDVPAMFCERSFKSSFTNKSNSRNGPLPHLIRFFGALQCRSGVPSKGAIEKRRVQRIDSRAAAGRGKGRCAQVQGDLLHSLLAGHGGGLGPGKSFNVILSVDGIAHLSCRVRSCTPSTRTKRTSANRSLRRSSPPDSFALASRLLLWARSRISMDDGQLV